MRRVFPIVAAWSLLLPAGRGAEPVEFNRDIRPIFTKHCTACHGGVKEAGELSLIYRSRALGKAKSGKPAIVPGDPAASELVQRINSRDPDEVMPKPKHGPRLSDSEIQTLTEWIRQGAKWEEHWSFMPPVEPAEPTLKRADWATTQADKLVLAKLEAEGLAPAPEASKAEWFRRASLDLTGLPPTLEEWDAFQRASAANPKAAMEAEVDRLLASPQYGERWAAMWLDLARYSDTTGFEKDPHRDIWPFRDWVIRAFNDDMPYDRFTEKQLAGDLLPNPEPDDLIATAFHRNTQNNTEGGTDDEEYRVSSVIDRVNTTWTTWQATTFGCVQCHSHPYDPIPHDDYYRFMAFFDNSEDTDLNNEFPKTKVASDPAKQGEAVKLEKAVRETRRAINDEARSVAEKLSGWTQAKALSAIPSAATGKLAQQADGTYKATGTNPTRSVYTITLPAAPLGALKVDILPESEDPTKWSEHGSVIEGLDADLILADGAKQPVKFKEVVADFLAGPYDPNDSISKGGGGFGDFPVLRGPRQACFVPETLITPPLDAKLEIRIRHGAVCNGDNQSCVLRNFRLSTTSDPALVGYLNTPERAARWADLAKLQQAYNAIPGAMIPTIVERADKARRDTRVFIRGNRSTKDKSVQTGLPEIVRPPVKEGPLDRMDLARWLTSERNPLAARVLANRLWAELFGIGIVETLEDFGTSGTLPTNQPLLDHLALRLSKHHQWHLKPFLRELVLSSTYRQADAASPALLAKDPKNQFFARGPRQRLSAEMVRDQALLVSGLLSKKQFGPPVYPPQPEGIWRSVYSGAKWNTSTGEDRYRRGIYTYSKRTSGYPAFLMFDAPTRDVCNARRITTNTPLQALVTLNDPAHMEFAKAFAKIMETSGTDLAARLSAGYKRLTLDDASPEIIAALASLHAEAKADYEKQPAESAKLGASPDEAALVLVANTMFNLDSALTR